MIYDDLNLSDVEGWLLPEEAEALYLAAQKAHQILEIGCFMGRSTCALAAGAEGRDIKLVVCDTFDARGTSRASEFDGDQAVVLSRLIWNLRNRNLTLPLIIVGESWELDNFSDRRFDLIFIDGAHDYDSVFQDLSIANRKIVSGGWIVVHDYGDPDRPGLKKAVDEFLPRSERRHGPGSLEWIKG